MTRLFLSVIENVNDILSECFTESTFFAFNVIFYLFILFLISFLTYCCIHHEKFLTINPLANNCRVFAKPHLDQSFYAIHVCFSFVLLYYMLFLGNNFTAFYSIIWGGSIGKSKHVIINYCIFSNLYNVIYFYVFLHSWLFKLTVICPFYRYCFKMLWFKI